MPMSKWFAFDIHVNLAPEKPGVYELSDTKQVIVYIGKASTSIKSRLLSHRQMKRFMKVKYFRFRQVKYPADASKLEHELCAAFKKANNGKLPRLNKRTPPKSVSSFWD